MYQAYRSIKLSNSWPNTFCRDCGESIDLDPWRDVKIGWSEVIQIAFSLWGAPIGFFNRDFLIVMEFEAVQLVFCGQGPRRGEIEINVPMDDEEADKMLQAFLNRVREVMECPRVTEDILF